MDKLERALEKARLSRKSAVSPPPASVAVVEPAPNDPAEPARNDSSTSRVTLDSRLLETNRLVARGTRDMNADVFRMLRTKVLQKMEAHNWRSVAITSPNFGDGKSTVAVNLALSLALDVKQTVLLVDLDLRSPKIHEYLGIRPERSLSDHLTHDVPLRDCLVKPDIDRLVVLPITRPIENSSELLASPKMAKVAKELSTRYNDRKIIYDMPPLLAQDDALAFLPHVDAVLLVVRDSTTHNEDVLHCMEQIGGDHFLGVVLNNSVEAPFKRR